MSKHPATLRPAAVVAARFGQDYGYRFDGDSVTLHASIQLVHYLAHEVRWFLQLQAIPDNAAAGTSVPHVVAEVNLPPLAELAGSADSFSLTAPSQPPADQGECRLSLALVSRQTDQPDELHDVAVFSRTERFVQPRFAGNLTCDFAANAVEVFAARIESPRDPANLSGTLALELWALSEPYAGGTFAGQPLAGVVLGQLSGQTGWDDVHHSLHCATPPAGKWNVTVMLREWTGHGYTTRDYRNLPQPLVIPTAAVSPPPPTLGAAAAEKPVKPRAAKSPARSSRKPKAGK